jgi:hypothetical protein
MDPDHQRWHVNGKAIAESFRRLFPTPHPPTPCEEIARKSIILLLSKAKYS